MTDADKPTFAQAFARLAVAQREKEFDAVTVSVYFCALCVVVVSGLGGVALAASQFAAYRHCTSAVASVVAPGAAIATQRFQVLGCGCDGQELASAPAQ